MEEDLKQEIRRYFIGNIQHIINYNNSGQLHGLNVRYSPSDNIFYIDNWFNSKRFGLETYKPYIDGIHQKYHL